MASGLRFLRFRGLRFGGLGYSDLVRRRVVSTLKGITIGVVILLTP